MKENDLMKLIKRFINKTQLGEQRRRVLNDKTNKR